MGLRRVVVEGESMRPLLRPGDRCLVRWGARPHVGDVVVARRPDRPDLLVVKRLVTAQVDGLWLEGDNPGASHDSWVFGPVRPENVLGVVVARYWPSPRPVGRRVGD